MHDLATIQRMNAEESETVTLSHSMTRAQSETLKKIRRPLERPRITVWDDTVYALRVDEWGVVRDYIIEPDGSYVYEQLDDGNVWNTYDSEDNYIG